MMCMCCVCIWVSVKKEKLPPFFWNKNFCFFCSSLVLLCVSLSETSSHSSMDVCVCACVCKKTMMKDTKKDWKRSWASVFICSSLLCVYVSVWVYVRARIHKILLKQSSTFLSFLMVSFIITCCKNQTPVEQIYRLHKTIYVCLTQLRGTHQTNNQYTGKIEWTTTATHIHARIRKKREEKKRRKNFEFVYRHTCIYEIRFDALLPHRISF